MVRVIDAIRRAIEKHRHFCCFEFFVPKTEAGAANLYDRIQRMSCFEPLFCSVTWGDDGTTAEQSIEIAATSQSLLCLDMQVNITGHSSTPAEMRAWLSALKTRGVHNLCVLRGGTAHPASDGKVHFPYAADLVKFIRSEFGDHFGIAVAGYPEGHEDCPDHALSLQHLKAKVDAGADLIITNMIFDPHVFLKFCSDCREAGILCPILPGLMPINSYAQFKRWQKQAPAGTAEISEKLHGVRNDDSAVRQIGAEITQQIIKTLFRHGVRGVYFFTMNQEAVVSKVLEGLDFGNAPHRDLPWKPACSEERRIKERVRPIHWAGRTKSYLAQTDGWDEFPNGRWGDMRSPAFREDTTYHTQLVLQSRSRSCPHLLSINSLPDVCNVFLQFLQGVGTLPWSDDISSEAVLLMDSVLVPLNCRGLLTINSQPSVNAARSDNNYVGWGPLGGYVYQKQYLEFFCSPEHARIVFATFDRYPSLCYMAVNAKGAWIKNSDNTGEGDVTAVTWGVFPGCEILQPTIVSREMFQTWGKEAFELWTMPFRNSCEVPPVIASIQDTWVLINVVDNEYVASPTPLTAAVEELSGKLPPLVSPAPKKHSHGKGRGGSNRSFDDIAELVHLQQGQQSAATVAAPCSPLLVTAQSAAV
jgi:methylenetetrahydrofolate reductase (NADPH)